MTELRIRSAEYQDILYTRYVWLFVCRLLYLLSLLGMFSSLSLPLLLSLSFTDLSCTPSLSISSVQLHSLQHTLKYTYTSVFLFHKQFGLSFRSLTGTSGLESENPEMAAHLSSRAPPEIKVRRVFFVTYAHTLIHFVDTYIHEAMVRDTYTLPMFIFLSIYDGYPLFFTLTSVFYFSASTLYYILKYPTHMLSISPLGMFSAITL